jgi:hypothetical protein
MTPLEFRPVNVVTYSGLGRGRTGPRNISWEDNE